MSFCARRSIAFALNSTINESFASRTTAAFAFDTHEPGRAGELPVVTKCAAADEAIIQTVIPGKCQNFLGIDDNLEACDAGSCWNHDFHGVHAVKVGHF